MIMRAMKKIIGRRSLNVFAVANDPICASAPVVADWSTSTPPKMVPMSRASSPDSMTRIGAFPLYSPPFWSLFVSVQGPFASLSCEGSRNITREGRENQPHSKGLSSLSEHIEK